MVLLCYMEFLVNLVISPFLVMLMNSDFVGCAMLNYAYEEEILSREKDLRTCEFKGKTHELVWSKNISCFQLGVYKAHLLSITISPRTRHNQHTPTRPLMTPAPQANPNQSHHAEVAPRTHRTRPSPHLHMHMWEKQGPVSRVGQTMGANQDPLRSSRKSLCSTTTCTKHRATLLDVQWKVWVKTNK